MTNLKDLTDSLKTGQLLKNEIQFLNEWMAKTKDAVSIWQWMGTYLECVKAGDMHTLGDMVGPDYDIGGWELTTAYDAGINESELVIDEPIWTDFVVVLTYDKTEDVVHEILNIGEFWNEDCTPHKFDVFCFKDGKSAFRQNCRSCLAPKK